ncbi:tryptophan-rich sensory protein [Roseobacter sinensis]|uniref:Tryptophan-rich sensory protein n=1 Tax=Roseobacter sinensis TaxID=2931391 RepID=A0ABT3BGA4_9RHOB|nr:tryptophan-rich sensory protein [Roseobacter sp. WL0113]MCV3272598.1 tryptophan-rich sensory protein [Roseobacter sp. WL0113]
MSPRLLAALTAALTLSFAASPLLVPDFGGFEPDQFPVPQVAPPVQPAGYAFAIWGVIYLWLIVGMGFGLLRRAQDPRWQAMRAPLCVSLAVGTSWLPVAVQSPVWAAVLIWVMLLSALLALYRAPEADRIWAAYPIGLYAGWLSAASCVALGLVSAGYGYLDAQAAALIFVFIALVLASAVQSSLRRTPTYALAVIWALVAVVVQNRAGDQLIAALAAGGAAALLIPAYKALRSERRSHEVA